MLKNDTNLFPAWKNYMGFHLVKRWGLIKLHTLRYSLNEGMKKNCNSLSYLWIIAIRSCCRKTLNVTTCNFAVSLFHDGGPHYIETSPLICSTNQWPDFYMIGTSVITVLKGWQRYKKSQQKSKLIPKINFTCSLS